MTDQDRALWTAAQDDYMKALKIAAKAWEAAYPPLIDVTPEALQAAAATILIHITKLRNETHVVVRVPAESAPAAATGGIKSAASDGAIPSECPVCSGPVWDNRTNKRSPKAPDWKCKDKSCVDAKGFVTGGWIKESPVMQRAKAEGAKAGVAAGRNFNEKPGPLVDDDDDTLPF